MAGPCPGRAGARLGAAQGLNAFTCLVPEPAPATPGALHGVPIVVKDIMAVAGLPLSGGSRSEPGTFSQRDAAAVAVLRNAGAVVIGLGNLHELAMGTRSSNPVFGTVRNPAFPGLTAGGSSGGSAAAVAAGVVQVALATDTGGSARIPAACCGVVGFKPSFGAISTVGVIEGAASLDHVGLITSDVGTCESAMSAYAQSAAGPGPAMAAGRRIGRLRGYFDRTLDPELREAVDSACEALATDGLQVDAAELDGVELAPFLYQVTASAEMACAHADRLRRDGDRLGEDVRTRLELGQFLPAHWYLKAQRLRQGLARAAQALFDQHDVLIGATLRAPAPPVGSEWLAIEGLRVPFAQALSAFTVPFSLLGLPALSLPRGRSCQGAPLAIQLVGPHGGDWQLLQMARRLERLRPHPR